MFATVANIAKSDEGLELKQWVLVCNVVVAEQFPFSIPSRIWISSNVGGANSIEQQEQQEQQQQDEEDAYLGQSEITNLHPNICAYNFVRCML